MSSIAFAANTVFHLFMIFLVVYSGIAIFILLRYGRSRIITVATSVIYLILISSLYFQALGLVKQL